ncbi:hypothetical protein HAX54_034500 [Datura stramonium]|uniref:Uncharacterized protein n=1 Tax=Datura stramonium TaxID=4076 RepID=A0ABS8VGA4_DATST|nr:hypothetical protein [Datura stramonium]
MQTFILDSRDVNPTPFKTCFVPLAIRSKDTKWDSLPNLLLSSGNISRSKNLPDSDQAGLSSVVGRECRYPERIMLMIQQCNQQGHSFFKSLSVVANEWDASGQNEGPAAGQTKIPGSCPYHLRDNI